MPNVSPELPRHIKAMLDPALYPGTPATVELFQTQMSFVFHAGSLVYKVKKPVNLGYLDYTTLASRRKYCEREVELNRRLCSDAYLGVIALVDNAGTITIGGDGEVVDYAVQMRYLPQDRMMNVLIEKNELSAEMVERVAQRLAEFHRHADTGPTISAFGNVDSIRTNAEENFDQTERSIGRTISPAAYRRIREYTRSFLTDNAALFQRRVLSGRIRDCHGDLHAAHICFTDGICIYDCIEFNDRFRFGDVASEVAFLAMDLDRYRRPDLSRVFVDSYVNLVGDADLLLLLDFYKCYRAYVRGKVESFKLDDPHIPGDDKAKAAAAAGVYFRLAESYATVR